MPVAAHLWNCDITLHHSISRHTSPQHSSSSSHITSRIAFPGVAQRGARNRLLLEDLIALLYQYSAHSDAGSPVAFTVYAPTPPFTGFSSSAITSIHIECSPPCTHSRTMFSKSFLAPCPLLSVPIVFHHLCFSAITVIGIYPALSFYFLLLVPLFIIPFTPHRQSL